MSSVLVVWSTNEIFAAISSYNVYHAQLMTETKFYRSKESFGYKMFASTTNLYVKLRKKNFFIKNINRKNENKKKN